MARCQQPLRIPQARRRMPARACLAVTTRETGPPPGNRLSRAPLHPAHPGRPWRGPPVMRISLALRSPGPAPARISNPRGAIRCKAESIRQLAAGRRGGPVIVRPSMGPRRGTAAHPRLPRFRLRCRAPRRFLDSPRRPAKRPAHLLRQRLRQRLRAAGASLRRRQRLGMKQRLNGRSSAQSHRARLPRSASTVSPRR